uniref:Pre-mRNA-splicing factor SLU7 n=1 Tax=Strigamia maritima TaxID=126957 RepID=T1J8A8_STRMM
MTTQSLPLSAIVKAKNVEEPKKKTREDWRKEKELEEARKAGTAPAAVDEEGKDINPHIPQYILQAPWYFGASGPTLKHQRPPTESQKDVSTLNDWYNRGSQSITSTRFRKGACENCGALTHKKKDCFERPRKIGARFTGEDIAPDEFAQPNLNLNYDGKRDRWNGYNPDEHKKVIEEFAKVDEAKRQLKAEKLNSEDVKNSEIDDDININQDEDKYADDIDMPGTKVDSKQRITVRNLRIREDTAKYLRNLDINSAYYDPKSRTMRDNPYKDTGVHPEDVQYAGDNFVRYSGDTGKHATAQMFAWQAYEKGADVHLLADPTKLELYNKEFKKKEVDSKNTIREGILDKYGGAEHLDMPDKELLLAQSEHYVEYSKHGKIIKGLEKGVIQSRYEEDVYTNNHTSVWGSYWKNGFWGYQCCHQFVINSYCIGESGKKAIEGGELVVRSEEINEESDVVSNYEEIKTLLEEQDKKREKKRKRNMKKKAESSSESSSDEDEQEAKERRLKLALLKEDESRSHADKLLAMSERKRPYNSMSQVKEPTQEEMEAYFMKKCRQDDPMADFLDK